MSVFPRTDTPYYHYEFQIDGARFRGTTGETSRRKAEQAEVRIRDKVEAQLRSGTSPRERVIHMTFGEATVRFWTEKGQHEANASTVWYQLENMVRLLGKNTLLASIGMSELADYQARRRGEPNQRGELPANRSINAEMPELFRRIVTRAAKVWSDKERGERVETGPERDWSALKLRVPKGRTRELQAGEETALFEKLRDDYADIIEFAMVTGLRRAALILRWSQVDLDAGLIVYKRKSLHDNDLGTIPISRRMRQLLMRQKGKHRTMVWTYVARSARDGRKKGQRYPITEEGLKTAMRRAVKNAGLVDWRLMHDLRHTAATRTLRAAGNLKVVQQLLGHADIASTTRYAHVLADDVKQALDAASPPRNPAAVENDAAETRRKA